MSSATRVLSRFGLGSALALSAGLLVAPAAEAYQVGTGSCSRWASARIT